MQESDVLAFCKCPFMPLMFTFRVCVVHTHDYIIRIRPINIRLYGALIQYAGGKLAGLIMLVTLMHVLSVQYLVACIYKKEADKKCKIFR